MAGTWASLSKPVRQRIFNMLRDSLKEMYDKSSMKWTDKQKLAEMAEQDMIYVVLMENERTDSLVAWASFKICREPRLDDTEFWEVLYWYFYSKKSVLLYL